MRDDHDTRIWLDDTELLDAAECLDSYAQALDDDAGGDDYLYRATNNGPEPERWKSPRFMPRAASRITLEVTDVRVQRVQQISTEDCEAEGQYKENGHLWYCQRIHFDTDDDCGCGDRSYAEEYALLWDRLNAKRGYPWAANPWVFAITFRRITP